MAGEEARPQRRCAQPLPPPDPPAHGVARSALPGRPQGVAPLRQALRGPPPLQAPGRSVAVRAGAEGRAREMVAAVELERAANPEAGPPPPPGEVAFALLGQ